MGSPTDARTFTQFLNSVQVLRAVPSSQRAHPAMRWVARRALEEPVAEVTRVTRAPGGRAGRTNHLTRRTWGNARVWPVAAADRIPARVEPRQWTGKCRCGGGRWDRAERTRSRTAGGLARRTHAEALMNAH